MVRGRLEGCKRAIPGNEISCQPDGSARDCTLCIMASSKGRAGWKKATSTPSSSDWFIDEEPIKTSGAKGSTAPTGAKLSKDNAAAVGGGDNDVLVAGEGWLYTLEGISKGRGWSGAGSEAEPGLRLRCRGRGALELDPGDVGSDLAIGFDSRFLRKRE